MGEENKEPALACDVDLESSCLLSDTKVKELDTSYISYTLQLLMLGLLIFFGWAFIDNAISKHEDNELELLLSQERFVEAHEIIQSNQIRQKSDLLTGDELQMVGSKVEAVLEFYYYSKLGDEAYDKGDLETANKHYNVALSMYFMNDLSLFRTVEKNIVRINKDSACIHNK